MSDSNPFEYPTVTVWTTESSNVLHLSPWCSQFGDESDPDSHEHCHWLNPDNMYCDRCGPDNPYFFQATADDGSKKFGMLHGIDFEPLFEK